MRINLEAFVKPILLNRIRAVSVGITRKEAGWALALALFVSGAGLMLMYKPFSQLEVGDSAGYDYIAQSILRGQLPYRDVIDIKTPGSMYLSALAMATGKVAGLRDVVAVRLFQSLLVGLLTLVIFQAAREYSNSWMTGLIAAVFPLVSPKFAEWMVVGTQPKLPMILFGMLSLFCISRDKPFWAGVTSMLAFLCWQPGLMFTGTALLIFSRYLTTWRDRRALKVLFGAALPLVIVFGYFFSRGALADLWAWTITFNYSVFGPETQRGLGHALNHIWSVVKRVFGLDAVLVLIAVAGFFMFAAQRIREILKKNYRSDMFRDAILIPPIVYFGFCTINMQAGPDLLPFIPFIGIFLGWFLVQVARFISSRGTVRMRENAVRWDQLIPGTALMLMLLVALGRGMLYRIPPGFTLQDQQRQFDVIGDLLGPDDKIYVHGSVELLVLLNRPNLNPYTFLNQGIDGFAAARRSGDFSLILDEMESQRPKLVALSRLRTVASRDLLKRWVDDHYDRLDAFTYSDVYLRKER